MNKVTESFSKDWQVVTERLNEVSKGFEEVSKKLSESENKRESNFYYVREEESYKYGARHWADFKIWYQKFIMFNPAYYGLPGGYVMHMTDENRLYTDPKTNITIKMIGVNSVSYELFYEYKTKCHEAQKQAMKWSNENEKARIEKFIKDVGVKQPLQLQTPDESVKERIVKEFEEHGATKHFNNNDFEVFTDALATHFSGEEYILPNPINLRPSGITKIAKAVNEVNIKYGRMYLSNDVKLFDLMRVLSSFAEKNNKDINRDMTRTK